MDSDLGGLVPLGAPGRSWPPTFSKMLGVGGCQGGRIPPEDLGPLSPKLQSKRIQTDQLLLRDTNTFRDHWLLQLAPRPVDPGRRAVEVRGESELRMCRWGIAAGWRFQADEDLRSPNWTSMGLPS